MNPAKFLFPIAALSLLIVLPPALAATQSDGWQRAVVDVFARHEDGEQRGGGFIVSLDADSLHIVTSARLVAGAQDIAVRSASDRQRFPAKVGRMQGREAFGLAVLVVRDRLPTGVRSLSLAQADTHREFVTLDTEGQQKTLRRVGRETGALQLTSAPGLLKGAPILYEGDVAGVIQRTSDKIVQATPLDRLKEVLDAWGGVQDWTPDNPLADLRATVERRDAVRITDLLGADPQLLQQVDAAGRTVLHWAVMTGEPELVNLILKHGASPGPRDAEDVTPLFLAVEKNHPELVESLLRAKADPDVVAASGDAAIHRAIRQGRLKLVDILLKYGAEPDLKSRAERAGPLGMTPLYLAVETGQVHLVTPLLTAGADVREENVYGGTVLDRVIQSWDLDLASRLIEVGGADLEFLGSALHTAIFWYNAEAAKFMLEKGADPNYPDQEFTQSITPLKAVLRHRHAPKKQEELLRLLLEYGADPRFVDEGQNAIQMARSLRKSWAEAILQEASSSGGRSNRQAEVVLAASRTGRLDRLRAASETPGWETARDASGRTALHLAAAAGHPQVVRWLLEKGANPTHQDDDGNTALHAATVARHSDCAGFLLARRSDPNSLNKAGRAPLHLAIENEDTTMIDLLLKHGAGIEWRTGEDHTPLFLASDTGRFRVALHLLERGADPRARNDLRQVTSLFAMVRTWSLDPRSEELARTLLARGANIDAGARLGGMTALEAAIAWGQWEAARFLIAQGAHVERQDSEGNRPIHSLAEDGQADLTRQILKRGADPLAKNREGQTALDIARLSGQQEVLAILERAVASRRPSAAQAPVDERIVQAPGDLLRGVVKISARGGGPSRTGAGLVLAARGDSADILTAAHVVADRDVIEIAFQTRRFEPMRGQVRGLEGDPGHDLAWIRVDGEIPLDARPLPLAKSWPPERLDAVAIGFPATEREDWHARATTVLSAGDDELRLQKGGIAPGNSGGPLLVEGVVVGVVQSITADTAVATAAPRVREILAKWRLLNAVESVDPGANFLAAAAAGEVRTVEFLLQRYDGLAAARDTLGRSALHRAVAGAHISVVEILLQNAFQGDALNTLDAQGQSALHLALNSADDPLVSRLLVAGADPNVLTGSRESPLHLAVRHNDPWLVDRLLDHGAQLEVRDRVDRTPLYMAIDEAHLEVALALLDRGARVNTRHGEQGLTPLARGILNTDLRAVRRLLENGADVHARSRGYTPIRRAVFFSRWPAIELLLKNGADPHTVDSDGNTLLHHASERGPESLVRLLLDLGADRRARNKDGKTASDLARLTGRPELLALLR